MATTPFSVLVVCNPVSDVIIAEVVCLAAGGGIEIRVERPLRLLLGCEVGALKANQCYVSRRYLICGKGNEPIGLPGG